MAGKSFLEGENPFEGMTPAEIMAFIKEQGLNPNSDDPYEVCVLLVACMQALQSYLSWGRNTVVCTCRVGKPVQIIQFYVSAGAAAAYNPCRQ